MEKSSNILVKTIIFIITVAIICLLFFGLSDSEKTDLELVSFGFSMFAIFVVYLSALLPGMIGTKTLSDADVISAGIIYAIMVFVVNYVFKIEEMRPLIVYNIAAILVYLLLFTIVVLMKKKHS